MSKEKLFQSYIPRIIELANKYGGRLKDDVLQEGLLGVLEAIQTYDQTNGSLDRWIKIKAQNKMRAFLRKETREVKNEERIIRYYQ